MSAVTLEIVGVYFRKDVELPKKGGKSYTVKEILDLAIDQYGNATTPGGIDYMTDGGSNPMSIIRHFFGGGTSRGDKQRMAGIYELREDRSRDPLIQAWQYYVLDDNNERRSATYPGEGFESFENAKFDFADGWKLIWRLVTVLREPNV